jgi:N utilization substance protein A
VPDKHLSLAIGKDGQNARLAAKLTGSRIDIKSASVAEAERAAKAPPVVEVKVEAVAAAPVQPEAPVKTEPAAVVKEPVPVTPPAAAKEAAAQPAPAVVEKPLTAEEQELLEEMMATSEEEAEKAEEKEEGQAETVLSSTFIPRRIIQPREEGKTQIRFAEDIFANRTGRVEDKSRKKKKKHTSKGKSGAGDDEG